MRGNDFFSLESSWNSGISPGPAWLLASLLRTIDHASEVILGDEEDLWCKIVPEMLSFEGTKLLS